MAVVPTGDPAWVRNADFSTYGGHTAKANYESQGVVNPRTDVGADAFSRMVADMAALVAVADFARVRVQCNDTSPAAPTIEIVHQMTGQRLTSYAGDAAPSGFPSASRNGDGDIYLVWAADYADPYGISGDIDFQFPEAAPIGTTAAICTATPDDPDVNGKNERIRVRIFDAAGVALADGQAIVTAA